MEGQSNYDLFIRAGEALSPWQCIWLASRWVIRCTPAIVLQNPALDPQLVRLLDEAGLVLAYLATQDKGELESRESMEILQGRPSEPTENMLESPVELDPLARQAQELPVVGAVGDLVYDATMMLGFEAGGMGKMAHRLDLLSQTLAATVEQDSQDVTNRLLERDVADAKAFPEDRPLPRTAVTLVPPEAPNWESIWAAYQMHLNNLSLAEQLAHAEQVVRSGVSSDEVTRIGLAWFNSTSQAPQKAPRKRAARKKRQPVEVEKEPTQSFDRMPDLKMESDAPWQAGQQDDLGFDVYADALANLIDYEHTQTPLVIAINAPWGAGKSSLANMIRERLIERHPQEPYVFVDFNAWMHDEAPNLGGAFAAEVIRATDRNRNPVQRFQKPIPFRLRSGLEKRSIVRRAVFLGFTGTALLFLLAWNDIIPLDFEPFYAFVATLTGQSKPSAALGVGAIAVVAPLLLKAVAWAESLAQTLTSYVSDPQTAASTGSIASARDRLGKLVEQASKHGKRRIVIFIDDAERCMPPKAVDILEALNQLLCHRNMVTVIMGDMPAIEACAALKYKDLATLYNPGTHGLKMEGVSNQAAYGRHYLQKIIQLQFDLPPHQRTRVGSMMERLASDSLVVPTKKEPSKLQRLIQKVVPNFKQRQAEGAIAQSTASEESLRKSYQVYRTGANIFLALFSVAMFYHLIYGAVNLFIFILGLTGRNVSYWGYIPWSLAGLVGFSIVFNWLDEAAKKKRGLIEGAEAKVIAKKAVAADQVDFSEVQSTVQAETSGASAEQKGRIEKLAHQEVQKSLIGDSAALLRAHAAAHQFLPTQPRGAKRLMNSLRVMLFICRVRRLIPNTSLTPEHLGKWAALKERWPQLAQVLIRRPTVIGRLETAAVVKDVFKETISSLVPELAADRDIVEFFLSAPKLAPVFEGMIYFDPSLIPVSEHLNVS